jgi:ligand-binding sensor domain-containing protein
VFRSPAGRFGGYKSVVADPAGTVWIGMSGQFLAVNPKSDFSRGGLPVERRIPTTNNLEFLLASQSGGFWAFTGAVIERWTADGSGRVFAPYAWVDSLVTSACEDRNGNLFVGTQRQGVFRFDASGAPTMISTNDGLSGNFVLSLQTDREGTLWVGTDGGGLNRLKRLQREQRGPSRG